MEGDRERGDCEWFIGARGGAVAVSGWGVAPGTWLNTFARNSGNLERKRERGDEGGHYSDLPDCELKQTDVCLLAGLCTGVIFVPSDSSLLIVNFFTRYCVVSNIISLWTISNRTIPSCHTVEGPAV